MVCPLTVDLPDGTLGIRSWRIVGESLARLYLTGGIRLDGPEGGFTEADLPGHQGRVAFASLAVERQPLAHDRLAGIVWDDSPPAQWKSALAAVISKIRGLMARSGMDGASVVASAGGTYAFAPPPETWVDLEHAYQRLDRAEGALRHRDATAAVGDATVASAIFRRPLLAGEDGLWLDEVRRRQTDALYRSFVALASAWNRIGDHQLAAVVAESAVTLDPFREIGHRLVIEAERARGDSGAALRAFRRCERILAEELGVPPSAETLHLADMLRSHRADD